MSQLANFLEPRAEVLVGRWMECSREELATGGKSEPELRDHIPDFLRELMEVLRQGKAPASCSVAQQHGRQRHRLGFSLEALVREYGLLRGVIFDLIEEAGYPVTLAEVRVLTDFIATAIAEAASEHVRQRERAQADLLEALKGAEMRFRRLAEAGIVGIIEWNVSGRLTAANDEFLRMLGYTREDFTEGRLDFRALTPPEHQAATAQALRTLQETGVLPIFEQQYFRKDGSRVDILLSSATLDEGRERGIALISDITERKQDEARKKDQADFEQQLIGIVSHDLRNPLNAILLGTTAFVRRKELDERAVKSVLRIQSSAERAVRMVKDLLDFTQARLGGGIPMRPGPLDLHALVRQGVEEVEVAYPGRQVEVRQEGEARGEWDSDRIAQVVTNLVTNALKYSPEGTPVRVVTHAEDDWVSLCVENEGAPIPSEKLPSLFEPLQRATADVDRTGRSVGLGLYIVKHIVDAHGGTITVESTEAEGTSFTVRLPRKPRSQAGLLSR